MSWKRILLEGDAAVLSDTVPNTIEPDDAASAGSANEASRQDHEHAIVAAIPTGNVAESASAAEGTATSFVRSDHVHACPATWAPTAHTLDSHSEKKLDTLGELTPDAGVTVDTCLIKDGLVADSSKLEGSTKAQVQDHAPQAHTLDAHSPATGPVDFGKQEATTLVLQTATGAPGTPVDGQIYFEDGDDHPYVYVAA